MECSAGPRRGSRRPCRHAAHRRSSTRTAARKVRRTRASHRPGPQHSPGRRQPRWQALTILDSYAVLAFLKGEYAASEVEALLQVGGAGLTALGVAEVLDHLIR